MTSCFEDTLVKTSVCNGGTFVFVEVSFILRKLLVRSGYIVSCFVKTEVIVGAVDFDFKVVGCDALRLVIFVDDGVIELFNDNICVLCIYVALRVEAEFFCCMSIGVVFISLGFTGTNLVDADAVLVALATDVFGR